jgi:hypothetical protein
VWDGGQLSYNKSRRRPTKEGEGKKPIFPEETRKQEQEDQQTGQGDGIVEEAFP